MLLGKGQGSAGSQPARPCTRTSVRTSPATPPLDEDSYESCSFGSVICSTYLPTTSHPPTAILVVAVLRDPARSPAYHGSFRSRVAAATSKPRTRAFAWAQSMSGAGSSLVAAPRASMRRPAVSIAESLFLLPSDRLGGRGWPISELRICHRASIRTRRGPAVHGSVHDEVRGVRVLQSKGRPRRSSRFCAVTRTG
jgi:hypothetical protein